MNYYVYEDDKRQYARVHLGNCQYCNQGKGIFLTHPITTRWHGPFATVADAQAFALSLKKKNAGSCGHCLPNSKPAYAW
jgi:F-type H+/Na+-transporting ATPase subunit beta